MIGTQGIYLVPLVGLILAQLVIEWVKVLSRASQLVQLRQPLYVIRRAAGKERTTLPELLSCFTLLCFNDGIESSNELMQSIVRFVETYAAQERIETFSQTQVIARSRVDIKGVDPLSYVQRNP
jgi:hypothetical protein